GLPDQPKPLSQARVSPNMICRGLVAMPPREPSDRSAQQQVWQKREQECDNRRLSRIKCLEHDDLISRVHREPQQDDLAGGDEPLSKPTNTFRSTGDHRPKV